MNQSLMLRKLNDDAIILLLKCLDINGQLAFVRANASRRVKILYHKACQSMYEVLHLKYLTGLHPNTISEFFQFAGPYIETIQGTLLDKQHDAVLLSMQRYCKRLSNFSITYTSFKGSSLYGIFKHDQLLLTHLTLNDCALNDYSIAPIKQLYALESLCVANNLALTGANLCKLIMLRALNISGCRNILAAHLIDIIKQINYLQSLNIKNCPCVNTEVLKCLKRYAVVLQRISLSVVKKVDYRYLTLVRHLHDIYMDCNVSPSIRFFVALIEQKADMLQRLILVGNSGFNTKKLYLLSKLSQLRVLYLGGGAKVFEDTVLKRFAKLQHIEKIIFEDCDSVTDSVLKYLLSLCKNLLELRIIKCNNITPFYLQHIMLHPKQGCRYSVKCCLCGLAIVVIEKNLNHCNRYFLYQHCLCEFKSKDDNEYEN